MCLLLHASCKQPCNGKQLRRNLPFVNLTLGLGSVQQSDHLCTSTHSKMGVEPTPEASKLEFGASVPANALGTLPF